MSTNHIPRFESRLRAGKILAPRNARPKTVPFIKLIEISMTFFLKNYFSQLR